MNRTLQLVLSSIPLFVLIAFSTVFATANDNAYGHAWSSNIGWISFNNCANDPATDTSCRRGSYGVRFQTDPSSSGTASGYAWSSNIGWISFNDQGCPTVDVSGCTGGAHIDWTTANADGSHNLVGWARACAVYTTGCSGTEKDTDSAGGWDGWIALNGKAVDGSPFGVTFSGTTFSGYAWGGEVVGWISFVGVKVSDTVPQLTLWPEKSPIKVGESTMLHATAEGIITGSCSIDSGIGSVQMTQSGTTFTMNPVSTGTLTATTTFTITCKNAKTGKDMSSSATVTVENGTCDPTTDPTCNGGSGSGTCSDGIKNGDETGIDTGGRCATSGGGTSTPPACNDGKDNDNDGLIDFTGGTKTDGTPAAADPGCKSATDNDERNAIIKEF